MGLNQQFQQFIIQEVKKALGKSESDPVSKYQLAKGERRLRISVFATIRDALLLLAGVISAGFGLKSFLVPNGFIDGGVMGISLLTNHETGIPLALLIVLINFPFVLLGWRQVSKAFAIKSMLAIAALAAAVVVVPYPAITKDTLLVSVFGGFFLGAGIGLAIRGGGVIDGTEILAIYFSRRRKSVSVGDFILLFNIIIFSVAAWLLSVETALYSILTYLAASKTVDFILEGIEEYTGVTIISSHNDEIAAMIKKKLGRGLTVYSGKRGFGKSGENPVSTDIIFTVITRLEINTITTEVEKIDPNAFMVMQSIKDTRGGMVKKRKFV